MDKKPWFSKTIWTNVILAASAFFPPVQDFIGQNPGIIVAIFTIANVILRLITKDSISVIK